MNYIDIVFDGPPGHESGRFVEVEDATGRSISVGEWLQRPDGLWALRIKQVAAVATEEQDNAKRCTPSELARLTALNGEMVDLVKHMLGAIDGGHIDSEDIDGDHQAGIPPHKWHEEWAYHARALLSRQE